MTYRIRLIIALLFFTGRVLADPYEDELLRMDVPSGFDGPITASHGGNMVIVAFRWPYPAGDASTLLQITKYKTGTRLSDMSIEEKGKAARSHLLQLLKDVAKYRSSFKSSEPIMLELGGLPAAKVSWEGKVRERGVSGVMYCVIAGAKVISFHTHDFNPVPDAIRQAIIRSIESVAIKHGG